MPQICATQKLVRYHIQVPSLVVMDSRIGEANRERREFTAGPPGEF
jgi:hypothetical protein